MLSLAKRLCQRCAKRNYTDELGATVKSNLSVLALQPVSLSLWRTADRSNRKESDLHVRWHKSLCGAGTRLKLIDNLISVQAVAL